MITLFLTVADYPNKEIQDGITFSGLIIRLPILCHLVTCQALCYTPLTNPDNIGQSGFNGHLKTVHCKLAVRGVR